MSTDRLNLLLEVDFDREGSSPEEMKRQIEYRLDELEDCEALTVTTLADPDVARLRERR